MEPGEEDETKVQVRRCILFGTIKRLILVTLANTTETSQRV